MPAIVPSSLFSVLSSIRIIRFMYRYFIYLSFDGRAYHGWQIQPNGITVEEALEKALSTLLHTPIDVTGAGRTDAGVNARLMVAISTCKSRWSFPSTATSWPTASTRCCPATSP